MLGIKKDATFSLLNYLGQLLTAQLHGIVHVSLELSLGLRRMKVGV